MNRRVFLATIFIVASINSIQAQILGGDDWVVVDTIGIVDIYIDEDTPNRDEKQLHIVCNKIRKIAKKLNRIACKEKSFKSISLNEWGKYGEVRLIPHYNSEKDTCHMERLFMALPDSLYQEEIVFKLYEYSKTIPYHVYANRVDLLLGKTLLERAGVLPATE